MPMAFAPAMSFMTNRRCISGSPPLTVKPPPITWRPCRYLPSCSSACPALTGMPLRIVQVSGLWQYRQRHMQPVVHATTRTPGPSTAEPVVYEWRNPMCPSASAVRTSVSGTSLPRLTRISNGLLASSPTLGADAAAISSAISGPVERAIDDVHLLLAREAHEIDRVPRHANGQARVFLRVLHRVQQRLALQHVDVHVITGRAEECVQDR